MKNNYLFICLVAVCATGFSCSGVKNVSGTLSKSDGRSSTDYSRHGDYLSSGSTRADSIRNQSVYQSQSGNNYAGVASNPRNADVYRKDYSRLADNNSVRSERSNIPVSVQESNQKMVTQYAEMDRLADVILYELDIIDRRWNVLLEQFRTAGNQDRDAISRELDKLNADQLSLYKSYTRIYKDGKTDWPRVKNDVETSLMNFRGLNKR